MYANFFGLRCLPFEDRADPQFTVPSAELEETLAALEYETHYNRGMALAVGAAGVGKTQMIRALLLRLHTTDHAVVVTRNAGDNADLIREACKGFGVSLASGEEESRLITRLRRHLTRNAKADHSSVLIVDNAENLTAVDLKQLAALNELCEKTVKLLTVILVGQPRILDALEQPGLERIKQNLFGHRTITALHPAGVNAYIQHRLKIAGAAETGIFAGDTIDLIHRITNGIPRLINQVCHSAMIAAYGSDERQITRATVIDVTEGHTSSHTPPVTAATSSVTPQRSVSANEVAPGHDQATAPAEPARDYAPAWPADDRGYASTAEPGEATNFGYTDLTEASYDGMSTTDDYDAQSRLERSLAQAERLSATTDAKIAQFSAIERHLATLAESAERLIAGLTQTTEHANRSFANTQQRMEAVLANSERRINDVDARVTQAVEVSKNLSGILAAVGSECERAEDVNSRLGAFASQLDDSMDEMQTRAAPLLDAVETAHAVQNQVDHVQQLVDQVAERIDVTIEKHEGAFAQRMSDLQAKLTHESGKTIERTQAGIAALNTILESSQTRCKEVEAAATAANEQISNASLQVGHLSETAKTVGDEANALISRMCRVRDQASPMIERAESTVTKIERAHLDAEALRVSVTDRLVDLGRACEQTDSLGRSVEACQRTLDHMLLSREWIETTVTELDSKVNAADACVKALASQDKNLSDIKKTVALAQKTTTQLDASAASASRIAERTNAVQKKLADTLGSSGGELDRIFETVREGSAVADQLSGLTQTGSQLHEALQGLVAHTDEKIGRLDSHSAAAGRILRELSEANKTGHGLIEQAAAQVKASEETAAVTIGKIESLTENVWSLTTKTETAKSHLAEQLDETTKVLDKIRTLADPARDAAGKLAEQVHEAQGVTETLADHASAAQEQLDAIEDLTPLLEAVRDADDSVRSTAGEIQAVRNELSGALQEAQKQAATLDSLNASAGTLIETQCQMAERMVDMSQAFDDKIVDTKTAITMGEELLGEFTAQADTINKALSGLTDRTKSLEADVDEVTAKRDSVLKSAEAQTAHLEKLCVAVRKVFAGVSKATLEARDQTELLRQAEGSSTEQLAALTTRTQQAAATLQEWVEEAIRVQTRLERAVGDAPSIQQTHPKETLQGLGEVVTASTQTVRTLDAQLVMQSQPNGAAAPSPIAGTQPVPKANSIAKMIEEAKQMKAAHS